MPPARTLGLGDPACMRNGILTFVTAAAAILSFSQPVAAQQNIDEPRLSPMLFGETEEERREKRDKELQQQREAIEISQEQSRDGQNIDEPRLDPLLFGPQYDDADADVTGTRITDPDDADSRVFFSALNFLVPDETNLSLGVGPVFKPDYFGSNDYEFDADPQVYIKVRNFQAASGLSSFLRWYVSGGVDFDLP